MSETQGTLETMFQTTEEDSELGKWFKLGKFAEVKVRRFSSKKSRKVREALEREYGQNVGIAQRIQLSEDENDELNIRHLATGILADWKGVKDATGKDVPYSASAAVQYLTALPDLKNLIATLSLDIDNFRKEVKDETEGN